MRKVQQGDRIKPIHLCNVSRFIDALNSINDGGEFESNYCNIYLGELELVIGNTDKHEAGFLDLDIKLRDGQFQVEKV